MFLKELADTVLTNQIWNVDFEVIDRHCYLMIETSFWNPEQEKEIDRSRWIML